MEADEHNIGPQKEAMRRLYTALGAAALLLLLASVNAQAGPFWDRQPYVECHMMDDDKAKAQCLRLLDIEDKIDEAKEKAERLSRCISLASSPSEIRDCHTFNW